MKTRSSDNADDRGSRLLRAVESIAISPADAQRLAGQYLTKCGGGKDGNGSGRSGAPDEPTPRDRRRAADRIIRRYSRLAASFGGATALAGVVPGLGTALATLAGGLADTAACMKLQVDMCMCLAAVFGYDITSEDTRHLVYLIAATGAVERAGVKGTVHVGSKAGVKMLRQYLQGAALQAVKQAFKKVGVTFTRKALEKTIPFGVGVVVSGTANYLLTRFVGGEARKWFEIDTGIAE